MNSMNGNPMWCRPARTREYDFGTAPDPDESRLRLLGEAPDIIRAAIKAGLVKPPAAPEKPALGSRSEWATCEGCAETFSREIGSKRTQCFACSLPPAVCRGCGVTFQPKQRKQLCCTIACRVSVIRAAAEGRKGPRVTVVCAGCGNPFEQTAGNKRKNCSRDCGLRSMAVKNRAK
jgi:hypothetical protein